MNIPDKVTAKDAAFIIEAKKQGHPYKAIVNGEEEELIKYYTHKGFTDIKLTKTGSKDSKPIDQAIRSCDEAKYYEYTFTSGAKYYGNEQDLNEFLSHLTSSEKKEFGKVKNKSEKTKEFVENWRTRAMRKLGN